MPLIIYGIEVYSGTSFTNLRKIKLCFNRIIRFVFGLHFNDHVSSYVFEFLGCSFDDFVNVRLLVLFYKAIKHGIPKYLVNEFVFSNSTRTHALICPNFSSLYMHRSFSVRVCRLWNTIIPYNQRQFSYSISEFKSIIENLV